MRDPIDVLRSFAGLARAVLLAFMHVDLLGPEKAEWTALWRETLADYFRTEARFFGNDDVPNVKALFRFSDFRKDVVGSLREVYGKLGLQMDSDFLAELAKLHEENTSYKERHEYRNPTLEELGLESTALEEAFKEYFDRLARRE
jgi:hypothetical protein